MKLTITPLLLLAVATLTNAQDKPSEFSWPNNTGAAVSLTYDDALASQLDVAYPQLQAAGLKGTFFIQGNSYTLSSRLEEWTQLATDGHELASHSLFHPCRKSPPGRDWVSPESDLDTYTVARISAELGVTNSLLRALDGKGSRTFAYPCGEFLLSNGTESYIPAVQQHYLAARGTSFQLTNIQDLSFYKTPTIDGSGKTLEDYVAYLEDAYEKGTVAVFMFHGVGGDYIVAEAEVHQQLLSYLAENQDRFWTAPYQEVMTHAHDEFKRLGWEEKM